MSRGITYTREGRGYIAVRGCLSCRVLKIGARWFAWHYGRIERNPVEGGGRSCAAPRINVPGAFRTRREAAEAGIQADKDENVLVPLAILCGMDPTHGGPYRLTHIPYMDAWVLGNDYDSATFRPVGGSLPGNNVPGLRGVTDPSKAARIIRAHVEVTP
jgi:hypothetical protein